jgi:hypothetical protein
VEWLKANEKPADRIDLESALRATSAFFYQVTDGTVLIPEWDIWYVPVNNYCGRFGPPPFVDNMCKVRISSQAPAHGTDHSTVGCQGADPPGLTQSPASASMYTVIYATTWRSQYQPNSAGAAETIAHELGHLNFGFSDEYGAGSSQGLGCGHSIMSGSQDLMRGFADAWYLNVLDYCSGGAAHCGKGVLAPGLGNHETDCGYLFMEPYLQQMPIPLGNWDIISQCDPAVTHYYAPSGSFRTPDPEAWAEPGPSPSLGWVSDVFSTGCRPHPDVRRRVGFLRGALMSTIWAMTWTSR